MEWSREEVRAWLDSIEWSHLLGGLKRPRGSDLAMITHRVMMNAMEEPEASYLFNAIGVLIDEHKEAHPRYATSLQRCISRRGKALSFPHTSVLPRAVSALLQHSQGR
jgi:hypothetical protein